MTKSTGWIYGVLVIIGSFVGGAVAIRFAPADAIAAKHGGTQTAEQFVLVGPDGKVRGAMGITPDGAVGLNLDDVKGQTRITLDVAPNGSPGLDFYDPQGKLRATFALGPTGTPGLGLYDANGKLRTSLDVPAANTPGLAFYHESGKPAWGAP